MKSFLVLTAVAAWLVLVPGVRAENKLSPRVDEYLASSSGEPVKVWVYFADHGEATPAELQGMVAAVALGERALQRRSQRSTGPLVDVHDLPVHGAFIQAVKDLGCRVRHSSTFLNAVSAYATADQIRAMASFDFVRRIDRVQTSRREIPRELRDLDSPPSPAGSEWRSDASAPTLDYGASYAQNNLTNVIPLHNANVFGEGVLVAMLDTGFNRSHESLVHLDVVAEWDFINGDPVTKNQPGDPPGQHNHGTLTLSALAGYAPGKLIGPAWAASFALGKTERVDVEIQQEEDDYVRGLEWAEALGADIVSSSLAYFDWYTYADMDGKTAVCTIAADIAVAKGMAVITAAGNEGPLPWPGILAPADGDSVVAVGAVDFTGVIAAFSSRGPTYDGRIKPDVCAQGVAVRSASASDSLGYTNASGTSLSTPLVAGAAALCLQMHPRWTPVELRDALRASADHAGNPDNDYGWGVIDAYETALNGATGVASRPVAVHPQAVLYQSSPNPFVPSVSGKAVIRYRVGAPFEGSGARARADAGREPRVVLAIYDVSGRMVRRLFQGTRRPGEYAAEWNGLDDRGVAVSSSVYYYKLSVGGYSASKKIVLIRR